MNDLTAACETFERVLKSERSAFYRDFYARRGYDAHPRTPQQWAAVPTLSKADIIAVPVMERLFLTLRDIDTIRLTSGTTGTGILIMPRQFASKSLPALNRMPAKRVLSFYYHTAALAARHEAQILSGDRMDMRASAHLAAAADIDGLAGPASVVLAFAEHLDAAHRARIILVRSDSERTSAPQEELLRRHYPNARLMSYYASQDAGEVALTPPDAARPSLMRVVPDWFAEVFDESGAPTQDGELVLTSVADVPFPLVRYRTGDRVRVEGELIELMGRAAEERVRIPGGTVFIEEIERAIARVVGPVGDFESTVSERLEGGVVRTGLELVLYAADPHTVVDSDLLAQELRVSPERTWKEGVSAGLYTSIVCRCEVLSPSGTKRKRLRDQR
jgi:phenylacetate-coenzyme A ligase PaaK-like adenylate-forming protein